MPLRAYYEDEFSTIFLGDCRKVLPDLSGTIDAVFDPPYGVGVQYGAGYDDSRKDYWEWFRGTLERIRLRCRVVVFTHRVPALRELHGWDWVGPWCKPGAFGSRIGNSCVLPHWEPVFMYGIHGLGTKSHYRSDVFNYNPKRAGSRNRHIGREKWQKENAAPHPCPKPLALFDDLIRAFSQDDAVILDPFMGSGTTLVAAKQLGRKSIGIEISEAFCEVAANRLRQQTLWPTPAASDSGAEQGSLL